MGNWWKYCLSLISAIYFISCLEFSDETFRHLSPAERQKLSADYVSMTSYTRTGSKKHMQILEKAARIDPKNEQAWKRLSEPFLFIGKYREWHTFSKKAIELNPKTWQGWRGYHKLYYFRDYGGALYDLDATDTLTINKTDYAQNQSVDYLRGLCYLGLKNHEKAIEYFELYLDKEKNALGSVEIEHTVYLYLARIQNYFQNYKAALDILAEVDQNEILADHYYQAAFAHFMKGEINEAQQKIELCREKFIAGDYHKSPFYEVPHQIYLYDIDLLAYDIECFL